MAFYLGFDSSTQSFTATAIEVSPGVRRVAFQHSIVFDRDLPGYKTTNGVRRHADPLVVTSPPLMWVDALDRIMEAVARQHAFDPSQIAAIGGCAQQHGTVYLNGSAAQAIGHMDAAKPLVEQLAGIFSRPESPVWMDESTGPQCAALARALGGDAAVARLTGSRPVARFAGPQIQKFAATDPAAFAATRRIDLVSSFMASLLLGGDAPMEPGDAAGMNLMDIRQLRWDASALDATAPDLGTRLPRIEPSSTPIGVLAPYWQKRYGFPAAHLVPWTGDNPSSLIGAGLVREGDVGISLGTSDTVFGPIETPPAHPGGANVFGSPAGGYMLLVCFRNGSLAREHIRDKYGMDWESFSKALSSTPAGAGGAIVLPWVEAEITPTVNAAGIRRFGLSADEGPLNVRALVEGQMMAMANHWSALADRSAGRILATGGASGNRAILQVMADVFGADVYPTATTSTASLGGALRAMHAHLSLKGSISWKEAVAGFTDGTAAPVKANPQNVAVYKELRQRYAAREAEEARSSTRQ
jgi:xylulokinase